MHGAIVFQQVERPILATTSGSKIVVAQSYYIWLGSRLPNEKQVEKFLFVMIEDSFSDKRIKTKQKDLRKRFEQSLPACWPPRFFTLIFL